MARQPRRVRRVSAILLLAAWCLNLLSAWDCTRLGRFLETVAAWHQALPLDEAIVAAWQHGDVCGTGADAAPQAHDDTASALLNGPLFAQATAPAPLQVAPPGESRLGRMTFPAAAARPRAEPPPTPPPVRTGLSC